MIRWLVGLFGPPFIELLEPTLEKLVRAAVDEAVESVTAEVEAIPSKVLEGVVGLVPNAGAIAAALSDAFSTYVTTFNPLKGLLGS